LLLVPVTRVTGRAFFDDIDRMKSSIFIVIMLLTLACTTKEQKSSLLHHEYINTNNDTTLVFVHGWCINGEYWKPQVEAFTDRYNILTLDLAGHGQSKVQRADWTIEGYAADVADLIRELELKNVVLIGHSMSGNVNLIVNEMLDGDIAGFIGIDNFHEVAVVMSDSSSKQTDEFLKMLETNYKKTTEMFSQSLFSASTDSVVRARVMRDALGCDSVMSTKTLTNLIGQMSKEKNLFSKLKVPLILINSDVNPVKEESLTANVPSGYKIFLVHGTGHYPMIEKPEEFNQKLQAALSWNNRQ